ncbi:hypothetical protein VP01_2207g3 [Puccinia sorghi]|uniref:Uncharacterized protein n=1 Tax=Puccinia sorghi TaxID=27349 RepID=A0A0L6V8Y2_9BASI|nr:hypothetical protein VP01_2207g3 [Puccinia sorghi]
MPLFAGSIQHQQTTNNAPRKQLSAAVHQRSLSVPATPDDRRPSRVHFEDATSSPHQAVDLHHQQCHPAFPSSPLRVTIQEVEKGVNDVVPPSRQSGDSQERTTRTGYKNQAEETQNQIDIDSLPQIPSESQLVLPITPAAVAGETPNDSYPPVNTGSTQPHSAQRDSSRPANTDNSAVPPSAPSPHGRNHYSQQRDQKPRSTPHSPSVPPYPAPSSSPELPPQVYPGKQSPLLPPPLAAPRPREISFPRPFRRRLSVAIEPSAVQLPPSPPPEFDFSAFENPPNLAASSSSLYNLLDDSPLIDLTDEKIPGQQATLQECCHSDVKKTYSHFTPLPSPIISEKPLLPSILSTPSTAYLPGRDAQDKVVGGLESQQVVVSFQVSAITGSEVSGISRSLHEYRDETPKGSGTDYALTPKQTPQSPSSPQTASVPAEHQTDHSASSHTPRDESPPRSHSKVDSPSPSPTQVYNGQEEQPATVGEKSVSLFAAMVAGSKRSGSRAPSALGSVYHSTASKPVSGPLTEEALRLHLSSAGHGDVLKSQTAKVGGAVGWAVVNADSSRATEVGMSRWEAGKSKEDELVSLAETVSQKNWERCEILSGLLRNLNHEIQTHDREAEQETQMVRQLGRARQQQLSELVGEVCGGSQFCIPVSSPFQTRPPPACIPLSPALGPVPPGHHPCGPPRAGNISQASIVASFRAHSLMENIRAAAALRAPRSHRAPSIADSNRSALGQVQAAQTSLSSAAGTALKAASNAGSVKAGSEAGTIRATPLGQAEAARATSHTGSPPKAAEKRHLSPTPSHHTQASVAAGLRQPSRAPSRLEDKASSLHPSAAGSTKAPSATVSCKAQSVAGTGMAPSSAAGNVLPSPVASGEEAPGEVQDGPVEEHSVSEEQWVSGGEEEPEPVNQLPPSRDTSLVGSLAAANRHQADEAVLDDHDDHSLSAFLLLSFFLSMSQDELSL